MICDEIQSIQVKKRKEGKGEVKREEVKSQYLKGRSGSEEEGYGKKREISI